MRRLFAFASLTALSTAFGLSAVPSTRAALAATPPPSPSFAPTAAPTLTGYYSFKTPITIADWPTPPDPHVHWTTDCIASSADGKSEVPFLQGMTTYAGTVITTIQATGSGLHVGDPYACSLLHDGQILATVRGTLPPAAPANQPGTEVPTPQLSSTGPSGRLTATHISDLHATQLGAAAKATERPSPAPTTAPTPAPTSKPTPKPTDTPQPPDGHALFAANCAGCHGAGGGGSSFAPRVAGLSYGTVSGVFKNPPQAMQGVVSHLSAAQLDAVARYVSQL